MKAYYNFQRSILPQEATFLTMAGGNPGLLVFQAKRDSRSFFLLLLFNFHH